MARKTGQTGESNEASSGASSELILTDREWQPTDGCAPVIITLDVRGTGLGLPEEEEGPPFGGPEPEDGPWKVREDPDPDCELAVAITLTQRIRSDKILGWVIEDIEVGEGG